LTSHRVLLLLVGGLVRISLVKNSRWGAISRIRPFSGHTPRAAAAGIQRPTSTTAVPAVRFSQTFVVLLNSAQSLTSVQSVSFGALTTIDRMLNVNDTTAPTITLPAPCPVNTRIVCNDVGGNGATATVTIAAPSGVAFTGNKTITTAFGVRTVTYTTDSTTVSQ
jgi:hypothetical protein